MNAVVVLAAYSVIIVVVVVVIKEIEDEIASIVVDVVCNAAVPMKVKREKRKYNKI